MAEVTVRRRVLASPVRLCRHAGRYRRPPGAGAMDHRAGSLRLDGASSRLAVPSGGALLARGEDEVVADSQRDLGEAGDLQPGQERGRLDRVVCVALVELVQAVAGQAVRAQEGA